MPKAVIRPPERINLNESTSLSANYSTKSITLCPAGQTTAPVRWGLEEGGGRQLRRLAGLNYSEKSLHRHSWWAEALGQYQQKVVTPTASIQNHAFPVLLSSGRRDVHVQPRGFPEALSKIPFHSAQGRVRPGHACSIKLYLQHSFPKL